MRGSDAVDLGLDIVPRWLARAFLLGVAALMALGFTQPVEWYLHDKTEGYTQMLQEAFADLTVDLFPLEHAPSAQTDVPV